MRAHVTMGASFIHGYEADFTRGGIALVRWDGTGPYNSGCCFTQIGQNNYVYANGDVLKMTISSAGLITVYRALAASPSSFSQLVQVTDTTYTTGNPGIGVDINTGTPSGNQAFGFSLFSATDGTSLADGVIAPARSFDWTNAGLPPVLPDGEVTANPWTPPTRTQCVTSQCNTVSGGSVTASTINAAITSAPAGTYVLIPAGTFALGGSITQNASNVTLRGNGAATTILTGGGIAVGTGFWGGATLVTTNPSKGDISVQVSSPPSAGRIAALEECDDGYSAGNANFTHFGSGTNCTGSAVDPVGPWVCELNTACDRNGGSTSNPHDQGQEFWINSVSGNTVYFTSPIADYNWKTTRTASLVWFNSNGTVGAGVEDLTVVGPINFTGTYACWVKGVRLLTTSAGLLMTFHFDAHSLVANSYIGNTAVGINYLIEWGYDGGESGSSDYLFINNIIDGGFPAGEGVQEDQVYAYNYNRTAANSSYMSNGEFQHHAGTVFVLREGNQVGYTLDDDTWGTHNFNAWFRDYISCADPSFPSSTGPGFEIGGWARFESIIGTLVGGGPSCTTSASYAAVIAVNSRGLDTSGLTQGSLMRWGNYSICGGDSHCNTVTFNSSDVPSNLASFGANSTPFQNPVPATNNLPVSFYMNMGVHPSGGTGLSWWKACASWTTFPTNCASYTTPPMPPIGPDVSGGSFMAGHAYNIPAAVAWASLPNDSNYTTSWGSLKQFDERVYQSDTGIPQVNTPTFNPLPGTFTTTPSVTISTSTGGATIRYTTNGTTPSETVGTIYSSPVTISSSLTLQAIAYESGFSDSAVASGTYVIQVATPTFSPIAGTYSSAQTITINDTTTSVTKCYTTDGSTPTGDGAGHCTHGTTYSSPFLVSSSATVKAIASKSGLSDSAVGSAAYTIIIGPPTAPTAIILSANAHESTTTKGTFR